MTRRYANERTERATRSDIEHIQNARLRRIIAAAYNNNPFYRKLYDDANVKVESIGDAEAFSSQVPFIDKRLLLQDQEENPPFGSRGSAADARCTMVVHTGGTSGIGQELHYLTQHDQEAWTTGFFYQARWAGIDPGERVVRFIRIAMELGGNWHKSAGDRYGLSQFFLGAYDTPTRIRLLTRMSPHLLIAQPSYLTRLLIEFEERGLNPRTTLPNLKSIMFAGEAHGGAEWVRRMESFWGVQLSEWYGSTQAGGSHMFSCEEGLVFPDGRLRMLHNIDHRIFIEVLDPETGKHVKSGEFGELVVTNLYNETYPVIRFRTYDRVKFLDSEYCDCGRPFCGIESGSVSRMDDMIKIRGQNVWPDTVSSLVFRAPDVEEYQVRVFVDETGRECVKLQVEFRSRLQDANRKAEILSALIGEIKRATDVSMEVEEAAHGTLPRFEQKARRWVDDRKQDRSRLVTERGKR